MITKRPANTRGQTKLDWLLSHHTFSFGQYNDPKWSGFKSLRVINDDFVAPLNGFDTHPHKNMEIITYVLSGEITHKDSTGVKGIIKAGDVQLMSAGSGIKHSERNESDATPAHFLQIWIEPKEVGGEASYQHMSVPSEEKRGQLKIIISPDGAEGSLKIRSDAFLYATILAPGEGITVGIEKKRAVLAHIASGSAVINQTQCELGDSLMIEKESILEIAAKDSPAEILLFDLAA